MELKMHTVTYYKLIKKLSLQFDKKKQAFQALQAWAKFLNNQRWQGTG